MKRRYFVIFKGKKLYLLWGDLHIHSEISRCSRHRDGNPAEKYRYARDIKELDFACITDHSSEINDYDWHTLQKIANLYYSPGDFVTFLGYEWIIDTPEISFHRQVIYLSEKGKIIAFDGDPQCTDPEKFWSRVGKKRIITILHQSGDKEFKRVWDFHNPQKEPLVEIFQVRGSYEHYKCLRNPFENRWQYYRESEAPFLPPFYRGKTKYEDWLSRDGYIQDGLKRKNS